MAGASVVAGVPVAVTFVSSGAMCLTVAPGMIAGSVVLTGPGAPGIGTMAFTVAAGVLVFVLVDLAHDRRFRW